MELLIQNAYRPFDTFDLQVSVGQHSIPQINSDSTLKTNHSPVFYDCMTDDTFDSLVVPSVLPPMLLGEFSKSQVFKLQQRNHQSIHFPKTNILLMVQKSGQLTS